MTSKILLGVLSSNGLHEAALRVATQTTEPSWGYWWAQGSTTCWETWKGLQEGTRNHVSQRFSLPFSLRFIVFI